MLLLQKTNIAKYFKLTKHCTRQAGECGVSIHGGFRVKGEFLILVPIIGIVGIVVGALLKGFFNRKNQKANNLSELQNKAYSDFLNAASKIAVAQRNNQRSVVTDELSNLADAKSRICVYGDSNVVNHLAIFLRLGGTLQTEQEILSYTHLCLEIRKSVGMQDKELFASDISQLLFSVDVKDIKTPSK